jgi:DNA-binding transcriptional regulator YiaG
VTGLFCGKAVQPKQRPGWPHVFQDTCGRRRGHKGGCRSVTAMRMARLRGATRQPPTGSPLVAAAIRSARKGAGLSQRRLALIVGVTETAVQHWEGAKRTPGEDSWVQLELTLGPLGAVRETPRPEAGETADAA